MMEVNQNESDRLWSYYQNQACEAFKSSYSRLQFLAKRCPSGSMVLNIGAGSGYLESLLMQRGVVAHSLDPSELTIKRMNEEQGMAGRAKQGYCHATPFPGDGEPAGEDEAARGKFICATRIAKGGARHYVSLRR